MYRCSILTLAFLLLFLHRSYAQTPSPLYEVTGSIYDSSNNEPVYGASVMWLKNDRIVSGATTKDNGSFILNNIEAGKQTLVINSLGYKKQQLTVNVSSATPVLNIELVPSEIELVPVEIIGSSGLAIRKMTGTATKIDEKTLREIRPIGTQEILQYVPGVVAASDDGMGNSRVSIGIRGLNPRRSSRVLILEDGIPIQPAVYVYPNVYYNPPVERIDRIEVIKGSSSIKYGPQTMGGVINYITQRPTGIPGVRVDLTGGTNNYLSAFAAADLPGSQSFSPQLQLLYKSSDGYRENNHFDQFNATFKARVIPKADRSVYIKANVNRENTDATYTGLTEYSFRTNPNYNPKKYDNFSVFRASVDVIFHRVHSSKLVSNTSVFANHFDRQWWRENDIYVDAATYSDTADVVAVPYYYKNYEADLIRVGDGQSNFGNLRKFYVGGVEHSYNWQHRLFSNQSTLETGGRVYWERFIDTKKIGNAPDARDGEFYHADTGGNIIFTGTNVSYETMAFAWYATESININNKLLIEPGVRIEAFEQERINRLAGNIYSDNIEAVVLPGLGLNYALGKYNIFGGVHRGYTPPSSSTLNILNFGASTAGIDLKAEKSWNFELGFRRSARFISFESALFYMYMTDFVAPAKGAIFKNLGAAYSSGIENTLHINPSKFKKPITWLPDLSVSYTYMQTGVLEGEIDAFSTTGTVDIAGKELPYAPHHSLIAGLSKEFEFGLSLRADYQYVSKVYSDYENIDYTLNGGYLGPIPAYYLINAGAAFTINKHFSVTATGKNLLDNVYIGSRLHSYPTDPEANISSGIIPGPRRQINIGIRYTF